MKCRSGPLAGFHFLKAQCQGAWLGRYNRRHCSEVLALHELLNTMAHSSRAALWRLRLCTRCDWFRSAPSKARTWSPKSRSFHSSSAKRTDGVFRELTAMRVRTPWIEALRKQQAEGKDPTAASGKPEVPKDRKLSPKRMDDSYHSVVLPLAQDPWLLDTYLNSSGHIRLGTIFMDLDALSGIIA